MTKWSQGAWQEALPVYNKILELPFIKELISGVLPREVFNRYLEQDALYIENYSRVLANIASRLPRIDQVASFLDFAKDSVAVEEEMHKSYLAGTDMDGIKKSPVCMLYCSLLSAQANAPVEVAAAAILPCFWVYHEVGKHIKAAAVEGNPYQKWIDTYDNPWFDNSNNRAIEICDELAGAASDAVRRAMTGIYVTATRMEWMFWENAYSGEGWKI